MITLFMRFVQDPANAFSWVVHFIFPHFQQLKGTSLSTGVCDHQLLNFKHRYSLHIWGWTRQASLLEVFFSWGIFFLESGLFQLRSKLCLVFFQQANPNLFLLPRSFKIGLFMCCVTSWFVTSLPSRRPCSQLSFAVLLLVTPSMWS